MLTFHSASVRSVNTQRAVAECLEIAFPNGAPADCGTVILNATLGHRLDNAATAIKEQIPGARVFGASGCAVTGREGVGESMNELAIMAVCGPQEDYCTATVTDIFGRNSYEKASEMAQSLKAQQPQIHTVYLLCPGIDIDNALVLRAFVDVFGEEVTIFGGTSSDNMRGLVNYQYHSDAMSEHDAWAVGISDPTLCSITRATHGFSAYGSPMVVTRAEGNRILELDGKPAWAAYTERLALPLTATIGETIAVGALAEQLPPEIAEEYGNSHILRVITKHDGDVMYYPMSCEEGLQVWLTTRNEDLIFSEQQRSLDFLRGELAGARPAAVFQTDCLARGRFLFNKVVKDEIIAMMHSALSTDGVVPPWLGNYGFGEYARLGGKNTYHNYSTSLLVLYRR